MRGGRGRGYGGMAPGGQRPRNPQNNIPRQLQPPQSHGGPMVTGHLQGLKDIDMELELLKRKREIIEQQQQILSNSYRQRDDYEQPMYNQARENRYDDYTRLYDNPREPEFSRGGRNEGRGGRNEGRGGRNDNYGGRNDGAHKRPHIPVWETEVPSPPKRFSAPNRGKNPSSPRFSSAPNRARPESRPQPPQSRPQPLFPDPRPARRPPPRRPPPRKREFNPTKVSKPTPAPPTKLANYQPAVRKKLVTDAVASGAVVDDSLVLRADREPTHLMVGRLELTLGAIIKDVKNANPQHENLFKTPHVMRAMKQFVRDRIRTAMIGKTVFNTDCIKAAYYEMYPFDDDDDVIRKGLMAYQNKPFIPRDTANPETYFKRNMHSLMILKLEEMVNKLSEIYTAGAVVTNKLPSRYRAHYKSRPLKETANDETSVAVKEDAPVKAQGDADPKSDETQAKDVETANKSVVATETAAENQPVEDSSETKDDTVVENKEKAEPAPEANTNDISAENQPMDKTQPLDETQTMDETQPQNDSVFASHTKSDPFVIPEEMINNKTYKALDKLLTNKMMHLIKKFAPEFVKVMDIDAIYRKNKAAIFAETAKKLKKSINPTQAAAGSTKDTEQGEPRTDAAQNAPAIYTPPNPRPPMYFVKILGKPSLPKRKAMDYFFNQFKPKTIKKHKNVHNLLFVGFLDKSSYDNILAADGTTVGRYTLDIKVSERNDPNKARKNNNLPTVSETDKLNESTDSLIGRDLDDQIENLLSSIRNTDDVNFSEDIIMAEPPMSGVNDEKGENLDQARPDEVVDCDADQNANNVANDDDVIEFNDVIENVNDGIPDTSQAIYDPTENFDETNEEPQVNDETNVAPQTDVVEIQDGADNNDVVEIQDGADNDDVVEIKDVQQNNDVVEEKKADETDQQEAEGMNPNVKNVKATPARARASARLATPATRTRRAVNRTE